MNPVRVAFVLEQSLGHVTYARNLREQVDTDPEFTAVWLPIDPHQPLAELRWLPKLRDNWSARASIGARLALRSTGVLTTVDALFFHTQVTSLCAVHPLRHIGGIISLDATPKNYDTVGLDYNHQPGHSLVEHVKDAINRRAFRAATRLVTWSEWARKSLIEDYGIVPERVVAIPPGTLLNLWNVGKRWRQRGGKRRLLFVGGDFTRKGGNLLIDVFREHFSDRCELDIVTKERPASLPEGAHLHLDLESNSPKLRALFADADLFVLPTRADCLAVVLMEATAAALPIITTTVGALPEAVHNGETGLLIPPNDGRALAQALAALVDDDDRRERFGQAGRMLAERAFDARRNAERMLALLRQISAESGRRRHGRTE